MFFFFVFRHFFFIYFHHFYTLGRRRSGSIYTTSRDPQPPKTGEFWNLTNTKETSYRALLLPEGRRRMYEVQPHVLTLSSAPRTYPVYRGPGQNLLCQWWIWPVREGMYFVFVFVLERTHPVPYRRGQTHYRKKWDLCHTVFKINYVLRHWCFQQW